MRNSIFIFFIVLFIGRIPADCQVNSDSSLTVITTTDFMQQKAGGVINWALASRRPCGGKTVAENPGCVGFLSWLWNSIKSVFESIGSWFSGSGGGGGSGGTDNVREEDDNIDTESDDWQGPDVPPPPPGGGGGGNIPPCTTCPPPPPPDPSDDFDSPPDGTSDPVRDIIPPKDPDVIFDSAFAQPKDCAGVRGGKAYKDTCGFCVGGTTGKIDCICPTDSTLNVTKDMLKYLSEKSSGFQNLDSAAYYINLYMKDFGVNTRLRLAYFLANAAEETENFVKYIEDTFFTKKNLLALWPRKFDSTNVDTYVGKSLALDRAYAEDGDKKQHTNGDEASKDGSTFRGRGLFHLTHRDSYYRFTKYYWDKYKDTTVNFEKNPDLLKTNPRYAVMSALWEFGVDKSKSSKDNYNALKCADNDNLQRVTALINGGSNGIDIRRAKLKLAKRQLCLPL